ncbi:MAG: cytochrome C oxidase subunit II [Flavobacteriales bacterium CG_4_10_14_0_2_um_filter_32_8]|nr:MAG: cytochrome C oxidase subunit II [Flavobacteriales bacterium CG_4_10_14_0_2_um_filter_32_8]PJB15616.1 MAG: cytochrome C oxidase subunit II [Flavobacteriales bacterium CG_4_9_14_3_um_filter_32_8]
MITTIIVLIILLAIITGVQFLKIAELGAKNRGELIYEITEKDSKGQSLMVFIFLFAYMGFFAWQIWAWGGWLLPVSASKHGVGIDFLMNLTLWIITPVFIITHVFLCWFAYKFAFSSKRKALFFTHSNRLELIWTTVPSIALTVLILMGLTNWNSTMTPVPEETDHILIELTGQQFTWTARYAGKDKVLGRSQVTLIEGTNATGVDTSDVNTKDDKLLKGEFHLPVNVPVQFVFRSLDVIHSAYMPHFRAQMNCVPGLRTQFNFVPTITTAEMRKITKNEKFNYILLCNKICGAAHYNMQMDIIVESQQDYDKWLAEQKEFKQ